MRTAFVKKLEEIAAKDPNVWLITGDLGYGVLDNFRQLFPDRFINVGVAEQNMMGIATGLALSGKKVFVYSIVNFPTFRCLEQIRNDVCYHNANVKIISVGGGYTYGAHGYSHHGVEDMAIMRILPYLKVISPGDPIESKKATEEIYKMDGPAYMRLGKAGEPYVHQHENINFQIGKSISLKEGKDLTIISTGGVLELAMKCVLELRQNGISAGLMSMHTIKPIDRASIITLADKCKNIVTIEEHGIGGLFTSVSEVISVARTQAKITPIFIDEGIPISGGNQIELREKKGISHQNIVDLCMKIE